MRKDQKILFKFSMATKTLIFLDLGTKKFEWHQFSAQPVCLGEPQFRGRGFELGKLMQGNSWA